MRFENISHSISSSSGYLLFLFARRSFPRRLTYTWLDVSREVALTRVEYQQTVPVVTYYQFRFGGFIRAILSSTVEWNLI